MFCGECEDIHQKQRSSEQQMLCSSEDLTKLCSEIKIIFSLRC